MPFNQYQGRRLFYRQQGQGSELRVMPGNTASSDHHAEELEYFGQLYQHTVGEHPLMWSQPRALCPISEGFMQTITEEEL